jgi:uroporphyrinogen decarboxylase
VKPRERVAAAVGHGEPDRCPFQATFTPGFAARLRSDLGLEPGGHHNPYGAGNSHRLEIALGQDILLTSVGFANSWYPEEPGQFVDEWGVGWRVVPCAFPHGTEYYADVLVHPLAGTSAAGVAIARYRPPDPGRDELYEHAEWTVGELGGEYWIAGTTMMTIFGTAWALRGYEQLLMDFVAEPDLAQEILEIPLRYHRAAAERLTRIGVDMIWLGDDIGHQSGLVMSPRHWRRFLKPRMADLIASLKAINPRVVIAYHTDGCVYDVIADLIEIGVDVLNGVQPSAMDPVRLKREYGHELCFWGSMDEQETMSFGTPADVRRQARERISTLGAGGGLILGPTHHVALDTPPENFWALVEEVTGSSRSGGWAERPDA